MKLGLVVALVCAAGCARSNDDEADREQGALIGGQHATEAQFPATLRLRSGCTGVKVGPKLILTAAHCVADASNGVLRHGPGKPIGLSRGAEAFEDHAVVAAFVHPSWERACEATYCGISAVTAKLDAPDVALIELEDELPDVPVVAIEAVALLPGDAVTLIGFGCEEGVHLPAPVEPPPLKFASGAVVGAERALHEGSPVTSKDVDVYSGNYVLTAGPARGGAGLCPGDSGGPLFVVREGSIRVAGVNANYTFLPDETDRVGLPITNWHTRLDDDSRHGVGAWLRSKGAVVR